jgi:hypothetical protein
MKPTQHRRLNTTRRYRAHQGLAQLLPLLTHIDQLRDQLHLAVLKLFDTVNGNRQLFQRYHKFLAQGGSTSADLRRYIQSQPFQRSGKIISRQHNRLRLVSTNKHIQGQRDYDPDDNQAA